MRLNFNIVCLAACILACAMCRSGKEEGGDGAGGDEPASTQLGTAGEEGELLDLSSSQPLSLTGGISLRVAALEQAGAGSGAVRIKVDDSEKLPVDIGGFLRLSPEIEVVSDGVAGVLIAVDIPFSPDHLPGGIERSGIYGAVLSDNAWKECPSFFIRGKDVVTCIVPVAPVKVALLAGPRHFTPEAGKGEGIAAAAAIYMKDRLLARLLPETMLGDSGKNAGDPSERTIYYLSGGDAGINMGGKVYALKKTRKTADLPLPYVVLDASGKVVKNSRILRDVFLAAGLREFFSEGRAEVVSGLLEEEKIRVEALIPGYCERSSWDCFAIKNLFYSLDDLAATLKEGFLNKEEVLLKVFPELVWVVSELERLLLDPELGEGAEGAGRSLNAAAVLSAVEDRKEDRKKGKKKPPGPLPDQVVQGIAAELDAAGEEVEKAALRLAGDFGVKGDLAGKAALLYGMEQGGDLLLRNASELFGAVGYVDILGAIDILLASGVEKAPSPDTSVRKFNVTSSILVVHLKGTDEDGRVTAYRYWLDEPRLPGLIKGGSAVKLDLKSIHSGMHTLYAAGVDDDGQQDETPVKFRFYVRRVAGVSVKKVEARFEGPKIGINSEHRRSAVMFSREVEAEVAKCTDQHFRFGIDGKGTIKVGMKFSGGKKASLPGKRGIVVSSYKNKALSGCVIKALKTGKLRYNQPHQPAADVKITFGFNPTVLFFDSKVIGATPGRDATAAVVFKKCASKAVRKIEAFCAQAAAKLPGPWDAPAGEEESEAGGEAAEGDKQPAEEGPAGDKDEEEKSEEVKEEVEEEKQEPAIDLPEVEFDPSEVMAECVKYSMKYLVGKCTSGATKKRVWCVDSCSQKASQCGKKCKTQTEFEMDVHQCIRDCWTQFMLPCSQNCILKNTPFDEK